MSNLTAQQSALVQQAITYLDAGSAGKNLDETAIDLLARAFASACGFGGLPFGSLLDALKDNPASTLLKLLLCSSQNGLTPVQQAIQDLQIEWTPPSIPLGNLLGLYAANANVPLNGILTLKIKDSSNTDGFVFSGGLNTLQTISFPNLVSVGEPGFTSLGITVNFAPSLTSISAPLLTIIRSTLSVGLVLNDNPALVSVNFPALVTSQGSVYFYNDTSLTALSLPAIVTMANGIDCDGCTALTTVSFPHWLPSNTKLHDFSNCALTAASINHVLARGVASPSYASGVLNLSGGTNAAPSGQGIADKATLQGRGVTVLTN